MAAIDSLALIDSQTLCAKLQIPPGRLTALIKAGLPYTGRPRSRSFDPVAVLAWLRARAPTSNGDRQIVHTISEVAAALAVSKTTIHTWITQGMPGRPASRGRSDGEYSLVNIRTWLAGRTQTVAGVDDTRMQARARFEAARAGIQELEYRKQLGELVSADDVTRRWLRFMHEAKAQFDAHIARVMRAVPSSLAAEAKAAMREALEDSAQACASTLQLFLIAEAQDTEHDAAQQEKADQASEKPSPAQNGGGAGRNLAGRRNRVGANRAPAHAPVDRRRNTPARRKHG